MKCNINWKCIFFELPSKLLLDVSSDLQLQDLIDEINRLKSDITNLLSMAGTLINNSEKFLNDSRTNYAVSYPVSFAP